ncbi:MAG: ATP-binding cassette domain-containing protein [Bacillota bacterium]|nr:ATP-binding cassette domain-containing protein [Bacillota bacterium]
MKLEVQNIKKSFGEREILHGISFAVESGRAMGFLGRNGAGKSTTIRCLMDVFRQDSGQFLLDDKVFEPRKMRIGYLPEERGMYQKNAVISQLVYFAMLKGASKEEATKSADYWVDRFSLNDYRNKKLETLSKGNQQKIQIAQAFLNEPDILILDEPFSGLDPVNSQVFKDIIAEFVKQGKLVIFSSHQMSYVEEVCDDVTLIHDGNIVLSGDLDQIKQEEGRGKLYLSMPDMDQNELSNQIKKAFPALAVIPWEDGLVLDTKGEDLQGGLLNWLADMNRPIQQFGAFEPSLTDIFIEKVGEKE